MYIVPSNPCTPITIAIALIDHLSVDWTRHLANMSWATLACLQTDAEGHESDEKLRLLDDQVPLRHRNRREIIHQDQEGSNANLPNISS